MKANMIGKLVSSIREKYYNHFPLYLYSKEWKGYVYTIEDKEDEQIGRYTDITVTSAYRLALNIRKLSKADRQALLDKVNTAMMLGNMAFKITGKKHG